MDSSKSFFNEFTASVSFSYDQIITAHTVPFCRFFVASDLQIDVYRLSGNNLREKCTSLCSVTEFKEYVCIIFSVDLDVFIVVLISIFLRVSKYNPFWFFPRCMYG